MTIRELKDRIDNLPDHHTVEIRVKVGGMMGGTPVCGVRWAFSGFDWDHGKFILEPNVDLQPKDVNELFPIRRKDKPAKEIKKG